MFTINHIHTITFADKTELLLRQIRNDIMSTNDSLQHISDQLDAALTEAASIKAIVAQFVADNPGVDTTLLASIVAKSDEVAPAIDAIDDSINPPPAPPAEPAA